MQPVGTPSGQLVWILVLAAAGVVSPSLARAPPGGRVDFFKHGSDWVQGNCASRKRQSPIDLNEIFKPPSAEFHYKYEEVLGGQIEIVNDGRVISATLANQSISRTGGLAIDLRGEPTWFNLTSIEIKSESEHTLRGKHFPLEIQLVHRPAHFYAQSAGPEAVTVSIFVDCANPPKAKQVYPGLLQQSTRPRKLRGSNATAFLQQRPEESDAFLPDPVGVEAEDEDDDPIHMRMNSEINFVHTLVEGEDALNAGVAAPAPAAAAPGAGPAGAPETAAMYSVPSPVQADFNQLLQFLVAQEPPDLESSVLADVTPETPFRLNALMAGGTYFYYWGSQTLPPCAERDLWLIKREVVKASTDQVAALYSTLHLMSAGAGNYRTGMPVNQRTVDVLSGTEGIPRKLQPSPPATHVDMGKEQKYINVAKDAITIAKAASDYAKDIDWRIQAGSSAHLKAMEAEDATTPAPTTSAYIPKPPEDQIWATKIMSNVVKQGIRNALQANINELIPATASLATSYLRQRILKKAGFGPPPVGAKVVAAKPIPGVPTFYPPETYEQPSEQNMTDMAEYMEASGCTAAANFSGCGNITGLSPQEAVAVAEYMAAHGDENEDDDDDEEEENVMTPEDVQPTLPQGAEALPADWPDPDGWADGLPPDNWPTGADMSVWPDPAGTKPVGWDDYKWERYKYNWRMYRSRYQPYRSSYSGYSLNRRRRMSSYSSGRRRGGYSSGRRRSSRSSYSSGRRRSSGSSGRRRSSSYSSGRRRSSSSSYSSGRRRGSSWR